MLQKFIYFITHGGEDYMTTRWHRVKCKVRWTWYMRLKPTVRDWWNNETYVPLICCIRGEVRAWRVSDVYHQDGQRCSAYHHDGMRLNLALPPGVDNFDALPQFKKSDDCYEYASEQWPQLQA